MNTKKQEKKYIPKGEAWLRETFLTALRSGSYAQAREYLRVNDSYCVLGLCMELRGVDWELVTIETLFGKSPLWSAGWEEGRDWFDALLPSIAQELGITVDGTFDTVWFDSEAGDHFHGSLVEMNDSGCDFDEIADAIEAALDPDNPFGFEDPEDGEVS